MQSEAGKQYRLCHSSLPITVVLTNLSLPYFREFYNRFFGGSARIFLYSFIPIESLCGRALDSRQIRKQLRADADFSREFSQHSDIDISDCIDGDPERSGLHLRDSFSNFDESDFENVGGDGDNDGRGGCNGEDDNKGRALWDDNSHDFYMKIFRASSGYKPPRSRQMPVSPDECLYYILTQMCLQK
jgi:hypothetical protein